MAPQAQGAELGPETPPLTPTTAPPSPPVAPLLGPHGYSLTRGTLGVRPLWAWGRFWPLSGLICEPTWRQQVGLGPWERLCGVLGGSEVMAWAPLSSCGCSQWALSQLQPGGQIGHQAPLPGMAARLPAWVRVQGGKNRVGTHLGSAGLFWLCCSGSLGAIAASPRSRLGGWLRSLGWLRTGSVCSLGTE